MVPKIKTVKRLRAIRRGCFVARRLSNYNRGMGYRRTYVACQTEAFQVKKYTKKGNKEGVWTSNKPNGEPN